MDDCDINNTPFILQCVQNATTKKAKTYDDSSSLSSCDEYNSLQDYIMPEGELIHDHMSLPSYNTTATYDTKSPQSLAPMNLRTSTI